jgi:ABC-type multidrug transport system ATPase subunit
MMTSPSIRGINLSHGTMTCLHIPQGYGGEVDCVEKDLIQFASQLAKTTASCHPATNRRGLREYFRHETSIEWLSRAAQISRDEAEQIIDTFNVPVANILSQNAGTPRRILGIAAALARKPDVLIYSTAGLDPQGCVAVHDYVRSRCANVSAIHLSTPAVFGDGRSTPRYCPKDARCLTLESNGATA